VEQICHSRMFLAGIHLLKTMDARQKHSSMTCRFILEMAAIFMSIPNTIDL